MAHCLPSLLYAVPPSRRLVIVYKGTMGESCVIANIPLLMEL